MLRTKFIFLKVASLDICLHSHVLQFRRSLRARLRVCFLFRRARLRRAYRPSPGLWRTGARGRLRRTVPGHASFRRLRRGEYSCCRRIRGERSCCGRLRRGCTGRWRLRRECTCCGRLRRECTGRGRPRLLRRLLLRPRRRRLLQASLSAPILPRPRLLRHLRHLVLGRWLRRRRALRFPPL